MQAQQALIAETNFRRAMENSMLTGMRALDMQGRITYVNAAFCQMTGWTEAELVGRTAALPLLAGRRTANCWRRGCDDELHGRTHAGRLPGAREAQGRQRCSTRACTSRRWSTPRATRPAG